MKKIRLMSLILLVVAIVSGMLAFKSRYHAAFCTSLSHGWCEDSLVNATYTTNLNAPVYFYTITNAPLKCRASQNCIAMTHFAAD